MSEAMLLETRQWWRHKPLRLLLWECIVPLFKWLFTRCDEVATGSWSNQSSSSSSSSSPDVLNLYCFLTTLTFFWQLLTTFWQLFDNFLTTFWALFDNFLTAFWQHFENMFYLFFHFCCGSQLWEQILWINFHIRRAYFTPNRTWSPNYSVLVSISFPFRASPSTCPRWPWRASPWTGTSQSCTPIERGWATRDITNVIT
jgi:hypothetical protein